MRVASVRPGCGGMCGVWSGPDAVKRPSRASRPCYGCRTEALGCRPEVGYMWWASRHEDVYQKYIHSTRARRGKTCTTALQTPTSMRTHYHASHAASAARRARRRRRRRQSSARRRLISDRVTRRIWGTPGTVLGLPADQAGGSARLSRVGERNWDVGRAHPSP